MAHAILLIIVVLFFVTRCDQQQAMQRSQAQVIHVLPSSERAA